MSKKVRVIIHDGDRGLYFLDKEDMAMYFIDNKYNFTDSNYTIYYI